MIFSVLPLILFLVFITVPALFLSVIEWVPAFINSLKVTLTVWLFNSIVLLARFIDVILGDIWLYVTFAAAALTFKKIAKEMIILIFD